MASYYEAAARSIAQNCSSDWAAVTRYVDNVFMSSNLDNETEVVQLKYALLKARLSGPGGNTTGADGLTLEQAAQTSDLDAASILMDPLDFYQVLRGSLSLSTPFSFPPLSRIGSLQFSCVPPIDIFPLTIFT